MPLLLHSHISPRALPLPFLNHSDAALTGWRSLRKSFLSGQAAGRSELPVYRSRQSVSSPVNTQPHSAGNRQHIRNLLWPSPAAAMSISACSLPVPPRGQSFDAFRASEAGEIPKDRIVYTHTDEAPMLATYSLLPILQRFAEPLGIKLVTRDISLAGRILAAFSDKLPEAQKQPDDLALLGELAKTPEANIIKLPNISASVPQLQAAISELQQQGYDLSALPMDPKTPAEEEIKKRYSKVLGSAVNPVLREGNSDRRSAPPVKAYAQKHPHRMKPWSSDSKCCVASMKDNDFFGNEQSHVMEAADDITITLVAEDGTSRILKQGLSLQKGEVIDATKISKASLCEFFEEQIADCKERNLLMSLHMKATMMKVSDPIIFGHCVRVFFKDVFSKYEDLFKELGINPNNGLGSIYDKLKGHPKEAEVETALAAASQDRPRLAMVDSSKGITNLHVPSDVIIDASMPCVVRDGGKMWNKDNCLEDVMCIIPDRSYAGIYSATIEDCKRNGQFDVSTMGYVANVGLMAQKAEEYGSHDKTFEIPVAGHVEVTGSKGQVIFKHQVDAGDIWRMCQTKDAPIRDWVKLAVTRARASGDKAIFWLDPQRPHDSNLIHLAKGYLAEHDTQGLDIEFMAPVDATTESCTRARAGLNTISVTGNVLRDYLTDLFPIIELGTSAKMLSIVPLLAGGCLLETGAGGSAPKHVQQFVEEGHLRWDSLGEYLATAMSFEELAVRSGNESARILGTTLMEAVGCLLDEAKSPSRKVGEIDNRGSNFYIAMYWARALAKHDAQFEGLARQLAENEGAILKEMLECQGSRVDIGGYYKPDPVKVASAMRPSALFNSLMELREA